MDKIQFSELIKLLNISQNFDELDINQDGVISDADYNSATDKEIAEQIQKVLATETDESSSIESSLTANNSNMYEKFYNELKAISDGKDYDINGDGKVNFKDIEALREKFNITENFGGIKNGNISNDVLKEKFGSGMGNIYRPESEKEFAYGAQKLLGKISTSIKREASSFDIDTSTSRTAGEGVGISDILSEYDELLSLNGDLFQKAFSAFQNKLSKIAKLFDKTVNSLEASSEELAQLKQIYNDLSSPDSTIFKKCKENLPLYKNRSDEDIQKLLTTNKFHGLAELDSVIQKTEETSNTVENISSQLSDGDIPEGKSVTFQIYIGNKNNYLSSKDGYLNISISKKNGKYIYSFDNRWQTETMPNGMYKAGGGRVNITDEQMDAVLAAIGDNKTWGNMYTQDGTSLDLTLNAKIDEALGAIAYHGSDSGDRSFKNELGQTSEIIKCRSCGSATTSYLSIFTQVEKIRDLLDAAKIKATQSDDKQQSSSEETNNSKVSENTSSESVKTSSSKQKTISMLSIIREEVIEKEIKQKEDEYEDILKQIEEEQIENKDEEKIENLKSQAETLKLEIEQYKTEFLLFY